MGFYDEMAATALSLLGEFGQAVTITRTTSGGYDPAAGGITAPTTASQSGSAVVREYARQHVDGTLIQAGDKRVILSASGLSFAPAPGDSVTAGGDVLQVVSVIERNPAGTPLVYELQGRR